MIQEPTLVIGRVWLTGGAGAKALLGPCSLQRAREAFRMCREAVAFKAASHSRTPSTGAAWPYRLGALHHLFRQRLEFEQDVRTTLFVPSAIGQGNRPEARTFVEPASACVGLKRV